MCKESFSGVLRIEKKKNIQYKIMENAKHFT